MSKIARIAYWGLRPIEVMLSKARAIGPVMAVSRLRMNIGRLGRLPEEVDAPGKGVVR